MTLSMIGRASGAAFALLWVCTVALAGAIGISPGVALVQDVPPGKEVNLAQAGQPIVVTNAAKSGAKYEVFCTSLSELGIGQWEYGYEDMPAGWCRLTETSAEIAAESTHKFELVISVPDKPENYNRRFMVGVVARRTKTGKPGSGISLQVCARFMVETVSREQAEAVEGPLAIVPSRVVLEGVSAGSEAEAVLRVRNNLAEERRCTASRLEDFYPPISGETEEAQKSREQKLLRYFGGDVKANRVAGWVESPEEFAVAGGGSAEVKLKVKVPAEAEPGKTYEEVVFLGDRLSFLAGDVRDAKGLCGLILGGAEEKESSPAKRIAGLLDEQTQASMRRVVKGAAGPAANPDRVAREVLNGLLDRRDLFDAEAFGKIKVAGELKLLLDQKREEMSLTDVRRLNRLLLEATYPELLVGCRSYGAVGRVAFVRVRVVVKKKE